MLRKGQSYQKFCLSSRVFSPASSDHSGSSYFLVIWPFSSQSIELWNTRDFLEQMALKRGPHNEQKKKNHRKRT
jgi:hypothetical protein